MDMLLYFLLTIAMHIMILRWLGVLINHLTDLTLSKKYYKIVMWLVIYLIVTSGISTIAALISKSIF